MTIRVVHRGKTGDVIYAMPAMRALARAHKDKVHVLLAPNPAVIFPEEEAKQVIPLLQSQTDYIADAEYVTCGLPKCDVDIAKDGGDYVLNRENIALTACRIFDVDPDCLREPWITLNSDENGQVFINKTFRYPNARVSWPTLIDLYPHAQFIGLPNEHIPFCEYVDRDVRLIETPNLLDVARLLAGRRLFIGNQSTPLAIAHGLHIPVIVETSAHRPNCIFKRANATYIGVTQEDIAKYGV